MRILVIGDFHGKFPNSLLEKAEKKKFDLVVSLGDYSPFTGRKLFFKYCYGKKGCDLWDFIGKERYKQLVHKDLHEGEKIMEKLNRLSKPVLSIFGNSDYHYLNDQYNSFDTKDWKWANQSFSLRSIKKFKNLHMIDYSFFKIGEYIFIGMRGGSSQGHVKSKNFKKYKLKLEKIFKRFNKENKQGKVILLSHNVPYNTKLDVLSSEDAPKEVRGKHYGSKLTRRVIDQFQPILAFGGHMHENPGKIKLKKTLVINPGAVIDNRFAIVELADAAHNNQKIKVKFFH